MAGDRMMRALARLQALVEKAGFREDQPRIPGGSGPGSGQWTYVEGYAQGRQPGMGDNGGPSLDPTEPPKEPPKDKVSKTQAAKALAKAVKLLDDEAGVDESPFAASGTSTTKAGRNLPWNGFRFVFTGYRIHSWLLEIQSSRKRHLEVSANQWIW